MMALFRRLLMSTFSRVLAGVGVWACVVAAVLSRIICLNFSSDGILFSSSVRALLMSDSCFSPFLIESLWWTSWRFHWALPACLSSHPLSLCHQGLLRLFSSDHLGLQPYNRRLHWTKFFFAKTFWLNKTMQYVKKQCWCKFHHGIIIT